MAPHFDEALLANLTNDIEHKLQKVDTERSSKRTSQTRSGLSKGKAQPKSAGNPPGHATRTDTKGKTNSVAPSEHDARKSLLKEIEELGGTKEDLEIIDAAQSDSEIEGGAALSVTPDLTKDIHAKLHQLGFNGVKINAHEIDTIPRAASQTDSDESTTAAPAYNHRPDPALEEGQTEWYKSVHLDVSNIQDDAPSAETVAELQADAWERLERRATAYASRHQSASARQFYETVMESGTLADKTSALTLSVQESPMHHVKALESLMNLAKKRSRAQAIDVVSALKDLFAAGALLPPDRHLNAFVDQPALAGLGTTLRDWHQGSKLPPPLLEEHTIAWAFEDWLKRLYFQFVQLLELWSRDTVVFARLKAIDFIAELLRERPEQESNLLRLLVNKLGDSEKKVASRASYNILQLEKPHPRMKHLIISSIESDILFRAGTSLSATYYGIITLNQTVLSGNDTDVVHKVLDVYFACFLRLLTRPAKPLKPSVTSKQHGKDRSEPTKADPVGAEADEPLREKILSAILTGINRAYPFAASKEDFFEKHLETLFKVTHSSNLNTSVQALMLVQQLAIPQAQDRLYRSLYESLLDPRLISTSKQTLYLNLLYRSLKADADHRRVQAFAKRLLQVASAHSPSLVCAVVFMLGELEKQTPALRTMINQPESGFDAEPDNVLESHAAGQSASVGLYDWTKRDPQWSHAENSCIWELIPFLSHFHPSAALFATRLRAFEGMPAKPDLTMHTQAGFLDSFVKQNPKAVRTGKRGQSIMQPLGTGDERAFFGPSLRQQGQQSFNSKEFWEQKRDAIDPSQVMFHQYYNLTSSGRSKKARPEKDTVVGASSDAEEGEDDIWQALVDSRPELAKDDDDDLSLSDLEADSTGSIDDSEDFEDEASGEDALHLDDSEDGGDIDSADSEAEVDMPVAREASEAADKGKRSSQATKEKSRKRQKLKHLPLFASADDYADALDGD